MNTVKSTYRESQQQQQKIEQFSQDGQINSWRNTKDNTKPWIWNLGFWKEKRERKKEKTGKRKIDLANKEPLN